VSTAQQIICLHKRKILYYYNNIWRDYTNHSIATMNRVNIRQVSSAVYKYIGWTLRVFPFDRNASAKKTNKLLKLFINV